MSNEGQAQEAFKANMATLANAVEVGAKAMLEISGNEISNAFNGRTITTSFLADAITARINTNLKARGV